MKSNWKAYFIFSEKELKAIVVIGVFIMASAVLSILFPVKKQTIRLFYFDPNTLDSNAAMQLGILPRNYSTLAKFRKKGGRFYKKEDLLKWYGVSEELLKKLLPYVRITASKNNKYTSSYARAGLSKLDINKADSLQLEALGIRPYLVGRIMKYRSYLGGFVSNRQLKKVYGLSDSVYDLIVPNLLPMPGPPPKMHWKTMHYKQLASLGIFERREIWEILHRRNEDGLQMDWVSVVTQFDLSREQANLLKQRTDIR
ncbi:MAG: helix-hairpin-helix domain-containing protein [Sediminibacterium sp.]